MLRLTLSLFCSLSLIHRERQHSFLLPFTMLECSFVPFLTDLSQESTLCPQGLEHCGRLWVLSLMVLSRGHVSHVSWAWGRLEVSHCPQTALLTPTPEHLCQRGMASLTVSCLGPAVEMTVVSEEGSLPVVQEGVCIYVHLQLPTLRASFLGFLLLCCSLMGPWFFCSAS